MHDREYFEISICCFLSFLCIVYQNIPTANFRQLQGKAGVVVTSVPGLNVLWTLFPRNKSGRTDYPGKICPIGQLVDDWESGDQSSKSLESPIPMSDNSPLGPSD